MRLGAVVPCGGPWCVRGHFGDVASDFVCFKKRSFHRLQEQKGAFPEPALRAQCVAACSALLAAAFHGQ